MATKMTLAKILTGGLFLSIISLSASVLFPISHGVHLGTMYLCRMIFYCVIVSFCTSFAYIQNHDTKQSKLFCVILSMIFSQFIAIGSSVYLTHTFLSNLVNVFWQLFWILNTVIWSLLLYPIILYVVSKIQDYSDSERIRINYKRLGITVFLTRVICLILFYPCIFDFDSGLGLRTMLQEGEIVTNHHPIAVQAIHYTFYELGILMGNPSCGMAVLSVLLIFFSTLVILYTVKVFSLAGMNTKLLRFLAYTLAIFPLFPLLSVYCTKDGFFTYSFLFFTVNIVRLTVSNGQCIKDIKFQILYFLSVIFVCLTRHQGIYIVIIESLLLMLYFRKQILSILGTLLFPILIVVLFTYIYLPYRDIEGTNKKEAYNMLFQQTARYLIENPNDIDKNQRLAINKILDIDSITKSYRYNITDDVKQFYKYSEGDNTKQDGLIHFRNVDHNGEDKDLKNYSKVWIQLLFKHPETYVDASLGVLSPYIFSSGICLMSFDTTWTNSAATTLEYSFKQNDYVSTHLNRINGYLANFPITDLLTGLSFYNWCTLLFLSVLIFRRDKKGITIFFPLILSVLVLLICPVAAGRYEYPIVITLPLLVVYTLKTANLYNKK